MKLSEFWFGFLLAVSVIAIGFAFVVAHAERGSDALGGEVFLLALPLILTKWRAWSAEQERKRRRRLRSDYSK